MFQKQANLPGRFLLQVYSAPAYHIGIRGMGYQRQQRPAGGIVEAQALGKTRFQLWKANVQHLRKTCCRLSPDSGDSIT